MTAIQSSLGKLWRPRLGEIWPRLRQAWSHVGAAPAELDSPWPDIVRGGSIAAVFFVGLVGWAAITPLDAAVVARGVVIVSGNRQAVQHLDGGIVRALRVKEGDHVVEGQVLLELVDTEVASRELGASSRLIELEAERARLAAEDASANVVKTPERWATLEPDEKSQAMAVLQRQTLELQARSGAAGARIRILKQQKLQYQARLPGQVEEQQSIDRQVKLLDDEIDSLSGLLAKGLTPAARLRALERERAGLQGRSGRIVSETAQTQESIIEMEGQIASATAELRAKRAEEKRQVESELADIEPKYNALRAQLARTQLRAPASGEVVALTAFTVGGVIAPGSHVMDIVPSGRKLVIEAEVKPEDGDEVHIGTAAKIKFPGLKGRDVPVLKGQVTRISADRIVEQTSGKAFFRAEVSVDTGELEKISSTLNGRTAEIRPGIPAEVVIPMRKRTALQYFYEPLVQALWKSFREQ